MRNQKLKVRLQSQLLALVLEDLGTPKDSRNRADSGSVHQLSLLDSQLVDLALLQPLIQIKKVQRLTRKVRKRKKQRLTMSLLSQHPDLVLEGLEINQVDLVAVLVRRLINYLVRQLKIIRAADLGLESYHQNQRETKRKRSKRKLATKVSLKNHLGLV
jgi:hypothetical protein